MKFSILISGFNNISVPKILASTEFLKRKEKNKIKQKGKIMEEGSMYGAFCVLSYLWRRLLPSSYICSSGLQLHIEIYSCFSGSPVFKWQMLEIFHGMPLWKKKNKQKNFSWLEINSWMWKYRWCFLSDYSGYIENRNGVWFKIEVTLYLIMLYLII